MRFGILVCCTAFLVTAGVANAKKGKCPAPVKSAVKEAYPGSTIEKCRAKNDDTSVKLTTKDLRKLELLVTSDGTIARTSQDTVVKALPEAVRKAFHAKYGEKLEPRSATRIELADGTKEYGLTWKPKKKKRRTAVFTADGKFVEEQ